MIVPLIKRGFFKQKYKIQLLSFNESHLFHDENHMSTHSESL